ncbi:MAG TPA: CAP domain-containing protein, partial [Lacipirellula sp.]
MAIRRVLLSVLIVLMAAPSAVSQMVEEVESESVSSDKAVAEGTAAELSPQAARLIVEQTNAFRQSENLEPVAVNAELEAAAQYFAQYMARTDTYGHTADGNRPAGRATRFGYEYCLVSENIAYQYSSLGFETEELATRLTTGWKESPGHRKNMLEPAVTETGVAVAQSPNTG